MLLPHKMLIYQYSFHQNIKGNVQNFFCDANCDTFSLKFKHTMLKNEVACFTVFFNLADIQMIIKPTLIVQFFVPIEWAI